MTSSDDGRPKAPGRKQSRLWSALCWAALTIGAVITALDNGLSCHNCGSGPVCYGGV